MKSIPLYVVKYFKGEETRTLSKHLHSDAAFKVGNRFVNNLKDKHNETADQPVILSILKITDEEGEETRLTLTNRSQGPLDEGVVIRLEAQPDPDWDYPQHSDPRRRDSGQRTTAIGHMGWPFTLIPK